MGQEDTSLAPLHSSTSTHWFHTCGPGYKMLHIVLCAAVRTHVLRAAMELGRPARPPTGFSQPFWFAATVTQLQRRHDIRAYT